MIEDDELKRKIDELTEIKKSCEVEIVELQAGCNHPEYVLKTFFDSGTVVKKICKSCSKEIGFPSKDELEKYLNNEK